MGTAKVIFDLLNKFTAPTSVNIGGVEELIPITSLVDILAREAWEYQRKIGWDQSLKGRLGKKWGRAHDMVYFDNTLTRQRKQCNEAV